MLILQLISLKFDNFPHLKPLDHYIFISRFEVLIQICIKSTINSQLKLFNKANIVYEVYLYNLGRVSSVKDRT